MARPKSDNPRTKRLVVWVTEDEDFAVRMKAEGAGMSVSDYLRANLGSGDPVTRGLRVTDAPTQPEPDPLLARRSVPRSLVPEGAPVAPLPKIARRHWADD